MSRRRRGTEEEGHDRNDAAEEVKEAKMKQKD